MNGCKVLGISLTDNEYIALLDHVNKNTDKWKQYSNQEKIEVIKKEINPVSLM